MTATPRAADLPAHDYTFRCGCQPGRRIVCSTHCQWQGCTRDRHTDACVAGERIPEDREQD